MKRYVVYGFESWDFFAVLSLDRGLGRGGGGDVTKSRPNKSSDSALDKSRGQNLEGQAHRSPDASRSHFNSRITGVGAGIAIRDEQCYPDVGALRGDSCSGAVLAALAGDLQYAGAPSRVSSRVSPHPADPFLDIAPH